MLDFKIMDKAFKLLEKVKASHCHLMIKKSSDYIENCHVNEIFAFHILIILKIKSLLFVCYQSI
jgi:pentose-5-phosphate-3-epimerase